MNYAHQQKAAWGTKVIDRLAAVDDLLRHPDDQPTIGLLLCLKKNKLIAEHDLRGMDQSIAVAARETQLTESLPEELRGSLPTIEEIEAELARALCPGSPLQTSPHNSSQPTRFTSSSTPTLENS